ncbi:hypothetical protein TNCV_3301891 [Trichonephila clavipes]|nr:hypothetical protein TNCV_3301891 [Trichonephila clavipes]
MWSMVAQCLTQITPPAATPDQLWQRVEAAWSAYPKNTSKVSLNQGRGVRQRVKAMKFETPEELESIVRHALIIKIAAAAVESGRTAARELLATDLVILNHGQVTRTALELVP